MMSQQVAREGDYIWPLQVIRAVMWSATLEILWVIPWIIFVIIGSFYFDFVEVLMLIADRQFDVLGIGMIFYGVIFSFFVEAIMGFYVSLETDTQRESWPWQARIVQSSFHWVMGIILVMLLGAALAFLGEIVPLPI